MTQPTPWPLARIIALYDRAEAALRQTAGLADDDARSAAAAGHQVGARVEHLRGNDARRAAERARRNGVVFRVRAHAERRLGHVPVGAVLDQQSWRLADPSAPGESIAVIATDLAGTVCVWNPEAERLYGWSEGEVLGRPITEFTVGPGDDEVAASIIGSVRRTGWWEGEFWVQRRDRSRFLAYVRDVVVADADGRPLGIVGFSVELSAPLRSLPGAPGSGSAVVSADGP
jgi:PAS domain S-box-containing protein